MKKFLFSLLLAINLITNCAAKDGFKDVNYIWNNNVITWVGTINVIPCKEPFHIILSDFPDGTTTVKIKIYTSTGKKIDDIKQVKDPFCEINAYKIEKNFIGFVGNSLNVKNWYYFEIIINCNSVEQKKTTRAYATPMKSEISKLEFFGGIGLVGFTQQKFKKFEPNIGFATGIKIKAFPVSTNPNIGRFGLSKWSKVSLVIASMVNDLYYDGTELKSPIIGIKPTLGIDFEATENLAFSLNAVFVNQETKSKLSNKQNLATGFFISLSFSSELFKSFKSNTPISPKI
jgi:hypothetical protein